MDWFNIDYLADGNERQQAAYQLLKELRIFEELAKFSPVLVGTIPIDIDIPGSDLDILLAAEDLPALAAKLETLHHPASSHFGEQDGQAYYVAKLETASFEIEFFAQSKATHLQNGYRHMLIEALLLELAGQECREAIRQLKRDGLKTEPAFVQYFKLEGNPYEVLREMQEWDNVRLHKFLSAS